MLIIRIALLSYTYPLSSIAAWGAVLACTAACKNFTGLIIVRTLLGIFECVCQPAFVFLSTMWYRREEQALVIGAFYSMNGFQQCVGGLIAYGVAQIQGQALKNWQILFTVSPLLTWCARHMRGLNTAMTRRCSVASRSSGASSLASGSRTPLSAPHASPLRTVSSWPSAYERTRPVFRTRSSRYVYQRVSPLSLPG